jgi:large subunit ribosomal protein L13
MAAKIAYVIQGKHSPLNEKHQVTYFDKIVIVNAKYTMLTGKKTTQKFYRHHNCNN